MQVQNNINKQSPASQSLPLNPFRTDSRTPLVTSSRKEDEYANPGNSRLHTMQHPF